MDHSYLSHTLFLEEALVTNDITLGEIYELFTGLKSQVELTLPRLGR